MNGEEIFTKAIKLAGGARDAFLAQVCRGDAQRRLWIEQLLRAVEVPDSMFERSPARQATDEFIPEDPGNSSDSQLIGQYRLREQIGEGGMGVV